LCRLQDETARVEDQLTKHESVDSLLRCFVTAKANSFENLLDPFLKITRLSPPVTICMTKSSAFFKRIIDRLGHNSKAVVRLNLLRVLRTVCDVHPNRAMLVERYGLLGVVERLSRSGGDGAVLVRELAREIVPTLKPGLKPALSKLKSNGDSSESPAAKNGGLALAPRKMRRAASETSAVNLGDVAGSIEGARLGFNSSDSSGGGVSTRLGGGGKPRPVRQRLGDIPWRAGDSPGGWR
jgi:hypothetical protein